MQHKDDLRTVFFVSDRTGKTAEYIGESLLSQFDGIRFEQQSFSFVNSSAEAGRIARQIRQNAAATGRQPLVFSTLVDEALQELIASTGACVISLFNAFIDPLEKSLGVKSSHTIGRPHEEYSDKAYKKHIDAIEFALKHDDGRQTRHYDQADVILIGVSRSAKTPTCLYLAMNFFIKAANYPLTDDELKQQALPDFLLPYRARLVGLTIRPDQLSIIREQRRPGSPYADLQTCRAEVRRAERMMQEHNLYVLDSSSISIEELAVGIVKEKGLLKHAGD